MGLHEIGSALDDTMGLDIDPIHLETPKPPVKRGGPSPYDARIKRRLGMDVFYS